MKPVVPAAFHNRVLQAAQEKSLLLEDKLVAVLIPVLTTVANDAADSFERVATKGLIASARVDADMRILGQLGPVASRSLVASLGLTASVAPNSTMIAVKPTPEQAEALAMAHPEATEPDDLHVTLAFLGHFDGDLQEIADALQPVAAAHAPLEGRVGGVGRFADNGKGAPAIVLPSVPGLVELRVAVTQALVESNLDYGREHGYQPHMTILYDKDGQTLPAQDSMNQPLTFNDLLIVRGNREQLALPLVGAKPLTAAASATADPFNPTAPDPVRQLLSAQSALADEAVQSAQAKIDAANQHLANAVHDGDAEAMQKAQREVETARKNYNRRLQAARSARKKFESLTPPTPEAAKSPSGTPSGAITPSQEQVKQVSEATDKTAEQVAEEKKASREAAARARADAGQGDALNREAINPTTGDFSTGANINEGIDLSGADIAAERSRLAQIAAQSIASWPPPASSEVIDVAALEEVLHQKMGAVTEAAAHNVIQGAIDGSGVPNLAFDITNPLAGRVLARSASQIVNISKTTQADVMAVIKQAHDEGLSIPVTAKLIRSKMIEATPARARLIARTELAGAVNGGSLAATEIVAKASGDTYTKQWLTAPGAHYPRHEDYPGLDEQTAPLDGTFVVGDADLKFPGDPDGPPEEVCNCRCTLVYIQGHVPYTNDVASTSPPPETEAAPEAAGPAIPPNIEQELAQGRLAPTILDQATPEEIAANSEPFKTVEDGQASTYLDEHYASWGTALEQPEIAALDKWQRVGGHNAISEFLHNGTLGGSDSMMVTEGTLKRTIAQLDETIAKAPPIEQGIQATLFRGSTNLEQELGKDYKVGTISAEKNFVSVTTDRDIAVGYSKGGGAVNWANPLAGHPVYLHRGLIQVELPPGERGAWMRSANLESGLDSNPNHELLLARDKKFMVTKVETATGDWGPADRAAAAADPLEKGTVVVTVRPVPDDIATELAQGAAHPEIVGEATPGEIAGIPGSQADLGITPFVGPRGEAPGDNPIGFYDSAKFQQFTKDIYSVAPEYGVTVDGFDRTHGVWDGGSEPSVALHAHDGVLAMRAYAARLGKLYDQEGVVIFDSASSVDDMLATFTKSFTPAEYDGVVKDMADSGLYGGRFTTDGKFQVSGGGPDFVDSVNTLSDKLGVGYDAQHGGFTLLEDQPAPDSIGISYQQVTDAYTEAGHAGEAGGFAPVPVDSAGTLDGVLRAEPGGAGGVEAGALTAQADPAGAVADLPGLAAEARKSPSFQDFENDFIVQGKQGVYYHVTGQKNFQIDPEKGPTDASTLSEGATEKGALMVTSDLENWLTQMPGRHYVAKIDMSAVPASAYKQVNRGFGNEFFVTDPSLAKVETVMTRAQARADSEAQATLLAKRVQGPEDLQAFYTAANAPGGVPAIVAEDLAKGAVAPGIVDEATGFEKYGPLPGAVAPKFKMFAPGDYVTEDGRLTLYRLEGVSPPAWNVEWSGDYQYLVGDTQPLDSPIHSVIVDGAATKKDALALFADQWPETRANILKFEAPAVAKVEAAAPAAEDYHFQHTAPDKESGAPMSDVTSNGIYPDDFYDTATQERYYGSYVKGLSDQPLDPATFQLVNDARDNPSQLVTVYRGAPADVNQINPGDWVTPSKGYAEMHEVGREGETGTDFHIISQTVRAGDLYTDGNSIQEWGWHPATPPPLSHSDAAIAERAGSPAKNVATAVKSNPVSGTAAPEFQQMKMLSTSATPDAMALDAKFVEGLPAKGYGPSGNKDALDEYDNRVAAKQIIAEDLSSRLDGNPIWDAYVREGTVTLGDSGLQVGDTWEGADGNFVVTKLPEIGGDYFTMKPKWDNADWYSADVPNKTYDFSGDTPFARSKFAPLTGEGDTATIKAAAGLIDNWAGTASDSNPWSLALQHAAEKEFNLPDASFERSLHSSDDYSRSQADQIFQLHAPALQAFVRAQYDATQEWLKLNFPGQDKMILYRGQGIGGIHALADEGKIDAGELDLQPMSSFSYTATTALNFVPAGEASAFLGMEVPFDRIMATARTGFGCLNENEFVVLGEPAGVTDSATVVTGRFSQINDAAFRGRRDDRDNSFWENAYNQEAIRVGPEPPTGNSFAYRRPDTGVATAFKISSDVNTEGLREITDVQTGEKIMVPAPAVKAAAYTNDVSGGKKLDYSEVEKVDPLESALLDYGAKVRADVIKNPLTEGGLPKPGAIFEHPTMPADADGYRAIGDWRVIKVNEDGTTLVRNMNEGTEYKIPTQDVVTALKINPTGTMVMGGSYKAVTPIASIEQAISPRGTTPALGSELKVGDQFKMNGETWTVKEAPTPTQYGYAKIEGKSGQMPLDEAKTYSKFAENVAPTTGADLAVGDQFKWNDKVYTVTKPSAGEAKGSARALNPDGTSAGTITFYDAAVYDKVVLPVAPVGDELVGKHFYAPNGNEYKVVEVGDVGIIGEDLNGQQIGLPMADATNKIAEWDAANASTAAELVGKHLTYVGKEFEVVQKIGPQLEVKLLEPGEFQGATYKIPVQAGLKGIEEYEQKLTAPLAPSAAVAEGVLTNGSELAVGDMIHYDNKIWKVQEVPTSSYKGVAVPVNADGKSAGTSTLLLNKDKGYAKAQIGGSDVAAPGVKVGDSFIHVKKDGTTELYHVSGVGLDENSVQVTNTATGTEWTLPAKPIADAIANYKEPVPTKPIKVLQEALG